MNYKSVITFIFEVVASYVAFSSMIGVYTLRVEMSLEKISLSNNTSKDDIYSIQICFVLEIRNVMKICITCVFLLSNACEV